MISNYTRPQTEIFQVLENTENPLLDRIHAVVVGPAFIHADSEAGNLDYETYQQEGELSYKRLVDGTPVAKGAEIVQVDEVKLNARNLRVNLFSAKTTLDNLGANPSGNILKNTTAFYDAADPSAAEDFCEGRPPTPGDIYRLVNAGLETIERRVVGILGVDDEASFEFDSYVGATEWTGGGVGAIGTVVTNTTGTPVTILPPGLASVPGELYIRRFGLAGVSPTGGLRLAVSVQCTLAGSPETASFTATVNGVAVPVTASTTESDQTTFTLTPAGAEIPFTVDGLDMWNVGDRLVVNLDYGDIVIVPDASVFDVALDVTAYTYASSRRRLASVLTLEVIAVSNPGYTLRISDSLGLGAVTIVEYSGTGGPVEVDIAYDGGILTFTTPSYDITNFHVGQRFNYLILPPVRSTTRFDKVQLNLPVGDFTVTEVAAFANFTGTVEREAATGDVNFVVGEEEVTLGQLRVPIPGYSNELAATRPAVDGIGQVALTWRAAISAGVNEGLVAIDSYQDIIDNYQSAALGSELGYGVLKAFNGSQGKRVYALNTGGTSREDFAAAFSKLESANNVYALALLTEDEEIMQLGALHVATMSAPSIKKFRRAYVGTDSPGEYPIIDLQPDGNAYTVAVQMGGTGVYDLVTFNQAIDPAAHTISKGDFLLLAGTKYAIAEVVNHELITGEETLALILSDALSGPVVAASAKVIAADTAENIARYVWGRSGRLGANSEQDRRISNIWQDSGTLNGTRIPNRFGACEIAGIRTALQPQQGLTRTEVSYIDSCPAMYTRFRPTLLDEMASRGVWIIAQNSPEGVVYVRHQLTTAVNGNLGSLYYEDNAGVNIDSICFGLDDLNDPLIGKRNATPSTVIEILRRNISFLSGLTKESLLNPELGPQIVNFYNAAGEAGTLDVAIDPNFKDRINEFVVVEIPLPLNNIRIVVQGRTIKNDGVFVNAITTSVSV